MLKIYKMKKEYREINQNIQSNEESRTVDGYAVIFESESEPLPFIEVIHRGAITEKTLKNSDVICKLNHNDEKVLARSRFGEGSLLLEVDDKGVRYLFEAPKSNIGDELLEYLRRKDIRSSSFAFTISQEEGSEKWYKKDGIIHRDIYKIDRLYDVSPVFTPAYEATTCSTRAKEMIEKSEYIDNKMNLLLDEIDSL